MQYIINIKDEKKELVGNAFSVIYPQGENDNYSKDRWIEICLKKIAKETVLKYREWELKQQIQLNDEI